MQRDGEILQVHELLPNGFSRNYQLPADTDVERIRWWWEKSPVQGRDKLIVDMPKVAKMAADVPGSGECAMPTAAEAPSTTDRQQKHARDLVLLATQKKRAPTAARHQERVRALAAERRRVEEERRRMEEERAAHQAAAARHEQRSRALAAEQQRLEQERLEQEAMAEAIAEKRGARDQPGVREEWASTAHLHKRYDTGRPRRSQPPLGSQGDAAATVPPKPAPWSSDDGLADDKSSNIGSNDHPEALHSPPKKDDGMMMTPPHRLEAFHIGRTATRPRHASSF